MQKRSKSTPSENMQDQKKEDEQVEDDGGKWVVKNTFLEWKEEGEGKMEGMKEKRKQ